MIKFLRDDTGSETIEWVLIAALVALVAVLAFAGLGDGGLKDRLLDAGGEAGSGRRGGDNNGKGGGCGGGVGGGRGGGCKK